VFGSGIYLYVFYRHYTGLCVRRVHHE
jgi:hypothetical protein